MARGAGRPTPRSPARPAGFGALAFLFCLGELGSVLIVHPPGIDVLPWRIFDLIHYGYDASVAGLALLAAGTGAAALGARAVERLSTRGAA